MSGAPTSLAHEANRNTERENLIELVRQLERMVSKTLHTVQSSSIVDRQRFVWASMHFDDAIMQLRRSITREDFFK